MSITHVFVVASEHEGRRLDSLVAELVADLSRSQAARLIEEGHVHVNESPAPASRRLRSGDEILVTLPPPRAVDVLPENISLSVLHEDHDLLVIDKPPGLIVHPGAGVPNGTLVNALLHHCGASLRGVGGELRPGIVHRLDKGTSGVMVVAKSHEAHQRLSGQFARREITKSYLAVVRGVPAAEGRVEAPIGRSSVRRTHMSVGASRGRQATTEWTRRESFGRSAALLEVRMLTGRTHQVRVHLAHARHPLIGDQTYGPGGERAPDPRARPVVVAFGRPALHAWRLGFVHPATGESLLFEAPVAADLVQLMDDLRAATDQFT
jgi:23S rRNA pseudouridine1911/1915/1917 synthase